MGMAGVTTDLTDAGDLADIMSSPAIAIAEDFDKLVMLFELSEKILAEIQNSIHIWRFLRAHGSGLRLDAAARYVAAR